LLPAQLRPARLRVEGTGVGRRSRRPMAVNSIRAKVRRNYAQAHDGTCHPRLPINGQPRHVRMIHLFSVLALVLLLSRSALGRQNWTELNVGPFFVDTEGDIGAARDALTQLEQFRWMLGDLLEVRDFSPVWPVHVLMTSSIPSDGRIHQVRDIYVVVIPPGTRPPLAEFTKLMLQDTVSRFPDEVERALPVLFSTMEAKGSRVTWGGRPEGGAADLNWARLQLLATGFEYSGRFHIFLTNLRNGSSLEIAARNAFDKSIKELDAMAQQRLTSGQTEPVTVGGRALDPKRDFGEHTLDPTLASAYLADARVDSDPKAARAIYTEVSREDGVLGAIGHEGLAVLMRRSQKDDHGELEDAMAKGSKSAAVYLHDAEGQSPAVAMDLLKMAARLNPRWAEPLIREAEITKDPAERENLLDAAVKLAPRSVEAWEGLAEAQAANQHFVLSHGSWLRAEGAALTPQEKEQIQAKAAQQEEGRLDAVERERQARRAADEADLARVREAEMARIREAEKKANATLDASSNAPIANPVPWWNAPTGSAVKGDLVRVECIGTVAKLRIRGAGGQTTTMVIRDATKITLDGTSNSFTCGPQEPPRKVTVSFTPHRDQRLGSDGDVLAVHFE